MTGPYELDPIELDTELGLSLDPTTPGGRAIAWWVDRVKTHAYVGLRGELPPSPVRQVLRDRELIAETPGKWAFVVRSPHTDADMVLRRNAWGLVAAALRNHAPAAIDRISAVRLAIGDEAIMPETFIRHGANQSQRRLVITDTYSIILRPDATMSRQSAMGQEEQEPVDISYVTLGITPPVTLPLIGPALLLTALTVGDVREYLETIAVWLRTLVVGRAALYRAYGQDPRPILLKRMGAIASRVGNEQLAVLINEVVTAHTHSGISRAHTKIGNNILVPKYIIAHPPAASPWLERQRVCFEHAIETVDTVLASRERVWQRLDLATVLRTARTAKLEDTYHSTTIEGYRITRDEVRAVIEGCSYQGRTPEEIERLMALKGYTQAFDWVLKKITDTGEPIEQPQTTDAFILDLFLELWRPSVDAGVVGAPALRAWRTQSVQIHGSRHVPPAVEKLGSLMTQFITQLNAANIGPVSRAVLAHWGLVNIHPFKDGNGRTARLFMNYLLGRGGLPWTTIRADDRTRYFSALEQAHVHNELTPFATFIADSVDRAVL